MDLKEIFHEKLIHMMQGTAAPKFILNNDVRFQEIGLNSMLYVQMLVYFEKRLGKVLPYEMLNYDPRMKVGMFLLKIAQCTGMDSGRDYHPTEN